MPSFPDTVRSSLLALFPHLTPVQILGPTQLLVQDRSLDLSPLLRMIASDTDNNQQEVIDHYLQALFSAEEPYRDTYEPSKIMPRIQPETVFQHLSREQVAHVPYVNDTVVVFVRDFSTYTTSITLPQMKRWGVTTDDLEPLARTNLDQYAPELEVQLVESKEGGKAAILSQHDGYDAARLLLGGLYDRLAPQLGGNFYVATPARDMFVAFSPGPPSFIERLRERVEHDFKRLPYPISSDFFYVTRDGVCGTKPTISSESPT